MEKRRLVIGTRGSKLALWQAEHVRGLLVAAAPGCEVELRVVHTKGDKILDVALSKIGDKGLFTKELERELLGGGVDVCVHSMKDMPTQLPDGLNIAGVPRRATPNDALVCADAHATLENLPKGARVATGSLRRVAQLSRLRPDVVPCEMRGNIDTRIRRVMEGEFDAAILAAAGIERLGIEGAIAQLLPADAFIPAVAQGAIAVEAREDDELVQRLCAAITHQETRRAVEAERFVLRALEGGCQVPMGAHAEEAERDGARAFTLTAFVASLDGSRLLRARAEGEPGDSSAIAQQVVDSLLAQGAEEILKELR